MTLEESIEELREAILNSDGLLSALRQFADAISAKASEGREKPVDNTPQVKDWFCTVCGNKPACGCEKPPEPEKGKCECGCKIGGCYCCEDKKETPPTDEFPVKVQMKIEVLKAASLSRELKWSELEELARLCFKIASRGRG